MRLSTIAVFMLGVASAAPALPGLNINNVVNPDATLESLSDYFNLLATKVQLAKILRQTPKCDVSKAKMPEAPENLPAPAEGLKVHAVTIGRGTQNYTCKAGDASAAPEAAGALAHLYDASCIAAQWPDLLTRIPAMAVRFNVDVNDAGAQLGASPLSPTGRHYFKNAKTPYFDLGEGRFGGQVYSGLNMSTPAPATAAKGQKGEGAVAWLKLDTKEGTTENVKNVYRVNTAGGSPPATCEGMDSTFEVEYATVYWFWEGDILGGDE